MRRVRAARGDGRDGRLRAGQRRDLLTALEQCGQEGPADETAAAGDEHARHDYRVPERYLTSAAEPTEIAAAATNMRRPTLALDPALVTGGRYGPRSRRCQSPSASNQSKVRVTAFFQNV